jgi:hypothetical protein
MANDPNELVMRGDSFAVRSVEIPGSEEQRFEIVGVDATLSVKSQVSGKGIRESEISSPTLLMMAEEITVRQTPDAPGGIEAEIRHGTISPCAATPPHVSLAVEQAHVVLGKRLYARGVEVKRGVRTLFRLPSASVSLAGRGDHFRLLPVVGYSGTFGLELKWGYDFGFAEDVSIQTGFRASQRRPYGWQAKLLGEFRPQKSDAALKGLEWSVSGAVAQEVYGKGRRDVSLDRLPEVALHWTKRYQRNGDAPLIASLAPGRDTWFWGKGIGIDAAWGRYYERPRNVEDWRIGIGFTGATGRLTLAELLAGWAGLAVSRYEYGRNAARTLVEFQCGAERRFGKYGSLSVFWIRRHEERASPFEFDSVELRNELQVGGTLGVRDWRVGLVARNNLDSGRGFSYEIGVARESHCMTPSLSYSTRERRLNMSLTVAGF